MSKRLAQVNELIRTQISNCLLTELNLPKDIFVSILKVDTTANLREAFIYLSIFPDQKSQSTFQYLCRRLKVFQNNLAKKINWHHTPKITLRLDYTERNASHIDVLLDKICPKD